MKLLKKAKEQGLSLRITSILMLAVSLAIAAVLLLTTFGTFRTFSALEKTTGDYIDLQEAAAQLMNASDYLTEEVQCYAVMGDRVHLDNYLQEAEINRRREDAILRMQERQPDSAALQDLVSAMAESVSLMDREYYAMRLVLDAHGDTDVPQSLSGIVLSAEDSARSPEDKTTRAQQLVHDDAYYEQKGRIRTNMQQCVDNLKQDTYGAQQQAESMARRDLLRMMVLIILQSAAVLFILWLTTHLGINPVLRAVDHIKKDQQLPIVGAAEFRYLAGTYNKMYNAYKKSIENLNFKASHDELTGVYNRAGYDLIRTSLDMESTAMLLFDADHFKGVNDTNGHETGDHVLQKIADSLKKNFRQDDYICRIGGDEFVVFMVHVNETQQRLIEHKVMKVNETLSGEQTDLPPITLSAGVAFGTENMDAAEMFRRADIALYYVKDHGRNGCCFYSETMKSKSVR